MTKRKKQRKIDKRKLKIEQTACHKKPTPDRTHATRNLHRTKRMPQETYTGQNACHKKPTPDSVRSHDVIMRTQAVFIQM